MTRTERRQLERQQAKLEKKSKGTILIDVATTLDEALTKAKMSGLYSMQYDNKVYLRNIDDMWKEYDVLPELFTLPLYRDLYNSTYLEAEVDTNKERDDLAKQIMLMVFVSNLGTGSQLDVKQMLNN
jgi:hypothetical protein